MVSIRKGRLISRATHSAALTKTRNFNRIKRCTKSATMTNKAGMPFLCSAVVVIMATSILSVDAIQCFQCNSHADPDCAIISTDQKYQGISSSNNFLQTCTGSYDGHVPFCRKTVVHIDHTEEHRIVRSCGWINTHKKGNTSARCLNADNEGFLEKICVCFEDRCNSAPRQQGVGYNYVFYVVIGFCSAVKILIF